MLMDRRREKMSEEHTGEVFVESHGKWYHCHGSNRLVFSSGDVTYERHRTLGRSPVLWLFPLRCT